MAEPRRPGDQASIDHTFTAADVATFPRLSGDEELRYLPPVHPGDRVQASVEVISVRVDKPVVVLRTWVETDGMVLDGEATVVVRTIDAVSRDDVDEKTR